jgi:hypothetical protein
MMTAGCFSSRYQVWVCRDCFVNWWEPAGKGCRDEVKLFRHKHLSKLVAIEMRKEFPDLETLPHLYVPFVQNRGKDWVIQDGEHMVVHILQCPLNSTSL